jgi:hypothetical protein
MPLWTVADQDQRASTPHHGVSLRGLPADERQRLLIERRDPKRRILGHQRRACHWRTPRRAPPLFLPALHELDVHPSARHRPVRQPSADDAGRCVMVRAFYRNLHERKASLGDHSRGTQLRDLSPLCRLRWTGNGIRQASVEACTMTSASSISRDGHFKYLSNQARLRSSASWAFFGSRRPWPSPG